MATRLEAARAERGEKDAGEAHLMGWYSVAEAIESNDGRALDEALAQEEDPARSLDVARNQLALRQARADARWCSLSPHTGEVMSIFNLIYEQLSDSEQAVVDQGIAALPDASPRPEGATLKQHSSDNHWPHKECARCRLEALEVALGNLGRQDLMEGIE
ncbi:MAG: hypothetical protein WBV94_13865 [Blastocatellia bacterium]